MDDYHVTVGERVEFEVEVSEEGAHVMWSVSTQEQEHSTILMIILYHTPHYTLSSNLLIY